MAYEPLLVQGRSPSRPLSRCGEPVPIPALKYWFDRSHNVCESLTLESLPTAAATHESSIVRDLGPPAPIKKQRIAELYFNCLPIAQSNHEFEVRAALYSGYARRWSPREPGSPESFDPRAGPIHQRAALLEVCPGNVKLCGIALR